MLNLCLHLNESQSIYAYELYAYKKESTCIPHKCKPFLQLIALAYFAISQNANLFVNKKLTNLRSWNLNCTFGTENFVRKINENFKEKNFAIVC